MVEEGRMLGYSACLGLPEVMGVCCLTNVSRTTPIDVATTRLQDSAIACASSACWTQIEPDCRLEVCRLQVTLYLVYFPLCWLAYR